MMVVQVCWGVPAGVVRKELATSVSAHKNWVYAIESRVLL